MAMKPTEIERNIARILRSIKTYMRHTKWWEVCGNTIGSGRLWWRGDQWCLFSELLLHAARPMVRNVPSIHPLGSFHTRPSHHSRLLTITCYTSTAVLTHQKPVRASVSSRVASTGARCTHLTASWEVLDCSTGYAAPCCVCVPDILCSTALV